MEKNNQKFTIVIPTRERASVLYASLRTATCINYDNLEIIVSDNYSSDETQDVVKECKDPRVRYINTGKRVSMSHNWEYALNHVNDGWVTFLGDDDGILPDAIEKVWRISEETGVQAIRSATCGYQWPGLIEKPYGRLTTSLRKGFVVRQSQGWLAKVLAGVRPYTSLPMLYNGGFVDTALIAKIRAINGVFYHSMTPDVFSAVAFARFTQNFAYCYEPLAINGASQHSGGTSAFGKGGLSSENTPATQYWQEPNIPFHVDLPLLPDGKYPLSIEALVYESYLQSNSLGLAPEPSITHDSQLEVILRNARQQHRDQVVEWGRLLAIQHGLDFDSIFLKSNKNNKRLESLRFLDKVLYGSQSVAIGSPKIPIRDVYEATIAAATIKNVKISNVRNLLARIYERLFAT